jgi:hypothetical protein
MEVEICIEIWSLIISVDFIMPQKIPFLYLAKIHIHIVFPMLHQNIS